MTMRIAGTVQIDGAPASREVIVISDDPSGRQVLAEGLSESDGTFDISYEGWAGNVIALALDSYGDAFGASTALNQGDIIHPTTPNGYVYEVTIAGTTGTEEPTWSTSAIVTSGGVTFNPVPFYRPVASGPLQGEEVGDVTPTDPEFSSVSALLHFDAANGSQDIVDETGAVWTMTGNAVHSDAQFKFGTASLRILDRDSPVIAATLPLTEGEPFTIEGWARLNDLDGPDGTGRNILIGNDGNQGASSQSIELVDGQLRLQRGSNAGDPIDVTGSSVATADQWTHFAITYDGTTVYGFLGGALEFSQIWSGWKDLGTNFRIGQLLTPNYEQYRVGFLGYLDEIRITDGVCRYSAAFTPPTEPFPDEGP